MPPLTSLRRDEAERRAALLVVDRYDIEVDLTGLLDGDALRCVSTVRFHCSSPGAETFVDCVADVVRAELNGQPLTGGDGARIALPDLAGENVLVVESVQRRTGQRAGVHRVVDPSDGEVYVWTSFEPDEARRAWACFDQPDLKAPFAFTVTAPAAWLVASNSEPEAVEDADGDARRWRFADTPPLSTYVPVVNAGPFHVVRQERGGYDLGLWCRRSLAPFLDRDAEELFTLTEQGLAFYAERFAMPFPQHRYDQVFVPEMGGAMENYGCVTWSDSFVYRHAPSYDERELRAAVLLHEMAHMWFGDIVTMRWWDDLWLNEAFAEWAAAWSGAAATEFTDAWATFLAGRKLTGYAADRAPTTHPIRQDAPDVAAAAAGFDMITYAKGASVLKQLVAYVGEESFVEGLRAHFAAHAWGNATLVDLVGALEQACGRDLSTWVHGWLETAGTDALHVVDGALVADGPDGAPARPHHVVVGVYSGDGALERRERLELDVDGEPVPLPSTSADLLLLNDDDLTFAAVVPDEPALDRLLADASRLPTALARTVAATTAWELLVQLRLPTARAVECLTSVLRVETAESVVEPMLRLAVGAARRWAPEADRERLEDEVAQVCVSLADSGPAGLRTAALRALARTARSEDQLALLDAAARDDVDLRWRQLVRLASLDRLDDAVVERTLADDPDPDAWVRAATARAAAPDVEAKEHAWSEALEARRFPLNSVGLLGDAFWQPGQDDVLAPYVERYLAVLPTLGGDGMISSMAVPAAMFPLVAVDAGFVAAAEQAVASEDTDRVVRRVVLGRCDDLRRMLAARGVS